jgi:hypothetical protein
MCRVSMMTICPPGARPFLHFSEKMAVGPALQDFGANNKFNPPNIWRDEMSFVQTSGAPAGDGVFMLINNVTFCDPVS